MKGKFLMHFGVVDEFKVKIDNMNSRTLCSTKSSLDSIAINIVP
jgi:hypothetical protein